MCNLSTGVFNRGYNSGVSIGHESGVLEGKMEMAYAFYDMGIPVEKIANAAQVSIDTVKEWLANKEEMLVK